MTQQVRKDPTHWLFSQCSDPQQEPDITEDKSLPRKQSTSIHWNKKNLTRHGRSRRILPTLTHGNECVGQRERRGLMILFQNQAKWQQLANVLEHRMHASLLLQRMKLLNHWQAQMMGRHRQFEKWPIKLTHRFRGSLEALPRIHHNHHPYDVPVENADQLKD